MEKPENGKLEELSAVEENWNGVRTLRCNLRPRLQGNKNLALNYLSFWREGNKLAKRLAGLSLELPKIEGSHPVPEVRTQGSSSLSKMNVVLTKF